MYDIFGKYGAIRQIRLGNASGTKVCVARAYLPHFARLPTGILAGAPAETETLLNPRCRREPLLSFTRTSTMRRMRTLASAGRPAPAATVLACSPDSVCYWMTVHLIVRPRDHRCDHLSGFNVCNRYLIVLYYQVRSQCCKSVPVAALAIRSTLPKRYEHVAIAVSLRLLTLGA